MAEVAFDETIHSPVRLRICGLLRPVDKLEFSVLRDTLDVSDATLSKHLKTLSTAGYATADKAASADRRDARRLTWLSLTPAGRVAFDAHVRALQAITTPAD
ncbi:MAG: transcriptional regulator [Actinomycetota bacterium]